MSNASWKAHFTQAISGYDPVEAQGLSELGYALRHNQIPEQEYLHWARENFELASLDMKFFQTHPAPTELYQRFKDSYAWGPECVPVAEWEEYILVAALQKPADFPAELKPIFLLAPIKGLVDFWGKMQVDESVSAESEGESEPQVSNEVPEGFNFSASPSAPQESQGTGLSFAGITLAGATHQSAESPTEIESKAEPIALTIGEDTGLKLKPLSEAIANSQPANPVSTSSYTMPPLNPKVPPPVTSTVTITKLAAKEVPAETLFVQTPPAETLENTVPEIKAQPEIIQPEPAASNDQQYSLKESDIKPVFLEFKKHYEKHLFIEINESKKIATAKFWPNELVATQTPGPHSITQDSFLSIVAKTQKPYHGHVVKNAITDAFFKEVNSGHQPENITVVPIVKGAGSGTR